MTRVSSKIKSQKRTGQPKSSARTAQLGSVIKAMGALSMLKARPMAKARPRTMRNAPAIRSNLTRPDRQVGEEFYGFITVPASATVGQNLFSVEVNPTSFSRLAVFASQYKQWRGLITMRVESLGNAFSTSSVSAAYIPDPDVNELPLDPTALLRVVNSSPSQRNLHLQDKNTISINANWQLSTNPWKFVQDTDPSDRSNGLFLIVANGSPGATDIPLKISFRYDVSFQGATYSPLESAAPTVLSALYGVNNYLSDVLFTPTTGAANWVVTGTSLTLNYPAGSVASKYYGSWTSQLSSLPNSAQVMQYVLQATVPTANVGRQTLIGLVIGATQTVYTFNAIVSPTAGTNNSFQVIPRIIGQ